MAHTGAPGIVVCGHLCLDIIPGFPSRERGHDWFRPGRLSLVDAPVISTGGAVSNVGLSLHRLGLPVRLVAKIGNDPLGRLIMERVSAMGPGLARGISRAEGEVTSYTVVLNPPGMDRIFLHCPGANDTFTDADVPDEVIEGASIFHFGYPPLMKQIWSDGGVRLERLLSRAKAQGAMTSLDMSLPDPSSPSGMIDWGALLSRVLPTVDLFVPSIEELLFMMDRGRFGRLAVSGGGEEIVRQVSLAELARLSRRAHDAGVPAVLIKLGDRGAYLHTDARGLKGAAGLGQSRAVHAGVFRAEHRGNGRIRRCDNRRIPRVGGQGPRRGGSADSGRRGRRLLRGGSGRHLGSPQLGRDSRTGESRLGSSSGGAQRTRLGCRRARCLGRSGRPAVSAFLFPRVEDRIPHFVSFRVDALSIGFQIGELPLDLGETVREETFLLQRNRLRLQRGGDPIEDPAARPGEVPRIEVRPRGPHVPRVHA